MNPNQPFVSYEFQSGVVVGFAGFLGTRNVLVRPPVETLREAGQN